MPANNEISIVFKAKTEEAANNIKKAAQNIEGLSVAGSKADSAMRKVGDSVAGAGDSAKSSAKSWGTMALEINSAIDLVKRGLRTLKSAYDMAKEGAQFQEVSLYAKNAAERIGLSFDSMVKASQRGANGMASNFTIMKANLKALKGGLVASEKDFEQLWKIANASSDELGQSIEQTFEQITKAITTGNAKSLISMGLLPESFKKASDSTDLLKNRSELLKTVLEQLGPKADELGKYGETAADKFQKLETELQNLKLRIGEELTPAVLDLVEGFKEIVSYGGDALEILRYYSGGWAYGSLDNGSKNLDSQGLLGQKIKLENRLKELEEHREYLTGLVNDASANNDSDDRHNLLLERRTISHEIEKLKTQISNFKKDLTPEKLKESNVIKLPELVITGDSKDTNNLSKDFDKLTKQINDGLNKALGITNKSLSDNIQMMHNVGLASLGFGAQVDEGAKKAYEAWKKLEDEAEKLSSSF
ncbi:MAG: hypothetical protein IKP71_02515, partial [Candidatus Riflebacteria bacterium]|nr:hypothetical protein [Candidatus Riflebacteria bacterium]